MASTGKGRDDLGRRHVVFALLVHQVDRQRTTSRTLLELNRRNAVSRTVIRIIGINALTLQMRRA
jgi:hypothetical protein